MPPTKARKPKCKVRKVGQTFLSVPSSAQSNPKWLTRKSRGLQILQVPALSKLPWLIHGFSASPGGVSELEGKKVLNLGFTDWDPRENVLENPHRHPSAPSPALGSCLPQANPRRLHREAVPGRKETPPPPRLASSSASGRLRSSTSRRPKARAPFAGWRAEYLAASPSPSAVRGLLTNPPISQRHHSLDRRLL